MSVQLSYLTTSWVRHPVVESEFAEMHIDARNEGKGVTVFDVFMRWMRPDYEDDRHAVLEVVSAELPRVADEMRQFLRLSHGSR